jgi:hypothetical protein
LKFPNFFLADGLFLFFWAPGRTFNKVVGTTGLTHGKHVLTVLPLPD